MLGRPWSAARLRAAAADFIEREEVAEGGLAGVSADGLSAEERAARLRDPATPADERALVALSRVADLVVWWVDAVTETLHMCGSGGRLLVLARAGAHVDLVCAPPAAGRSWALAAGRHSGGDCGDVTVLARSLERLVPWGDRARVCLVCRGDMPDRVQRFFFPRGCVCRACARELTGEGAPWTSDALTRGTAAGHRRMRDDALVWKPESWDLPLPAKAGVVVPPCRACKVELEVEAPRFVGEGYVSLCVACHYSLVGQPGALPGEFFAVTPWEHLQLLQELPADGGPPDPAGPGDGAQGVAPQASSSSSSSSSVSSASSTRPAA
eukprot:Rhum_TRINITY_DN14891_c1_g1::Rhum_TRINITY_DN14891_c1_g1_i1::g.125075::m.125075